GLAQQPSPPAPQRRPRPPLVRGGPILSADPRPGTGRAGVGRGSASAWARAVGSAAVVTGTVASWLVVRRRLGRGSSIGKLAEGSIRKQHVGRPVQHHFKQGLPGPVVYVNCAGMPAKTRTSRSA